MTYHQFDGFLSPVLPITLSDPNTNAARNLTGINIATVSIRFQNTSDTSQVITGSGSFALVSAASGQISYQWHYADMESLVPNTYKTYVIAKVPGDSDYTAFYIGDTVLLFLPGGSFVATQDVNIQQIGSANVAQTVPGGDGTSIATPAGTAPFVLYIPAVNPPKMPVKAASGDFDTGSIEDLLTLLTLAGAAGDANTANTLMGRLTKIRDLLNTTLAVQDIEAANYVALSSPPAQTNAGADTVLTFSSQVNRVILQNNAPANANFAFDAEASAGSLLLAPGQTFIYAKKVISPHLYTASVQNINGTSASNIVVLGAL